VTIDRLEITKTNGRLNSEYIDSAISIEKAHAALQKIRNPNKKTKKSKNKKR
jgi:hypothetical protein